MNDFGPIKKKIGIGNSSLPQGKRSRHRTLDERKDDKLVTPVKQINQVGKKAAGLAKKLAPKSLR